MALFSLRSLARFASMLGIAFCAVGCPKPTSPKVDRPEAADKWIRRATTEFQAADLDDARDAVNRALAIVPDDVEARLVSAKIALARLEYAEALRSLKGVGGSEAAGLRGRALWYKGDLEASADELDAMLADPDVKDAWAKEISKLARQGAGRTPFAISGSSIVALEVPHVSPSAPLFVVSVEIDGEAALALVATGSPEVVLDASTRHEPSWISLRFDQRLEVHDVPAVVRDLSAISKQLNAPIRALLGANLLRHLNVTTDYEGHQFVLRKAAAPPPPDATRLDLVYARGGAMACVAGLGTGDSKTRATFTVDTTSPFPATLDEAGWKKAGVDLATLAVVPEDPAQKLKAGTIPALSLGELSLSRVPAVLAQLSESERAMGIDLDGTLGAGLLSRYRITFADGGRVAWIEEHENIDRMLLDSAPRAAVPPSSGDDKSRPALRDPRRPDAPPAPPAELDRGGR